MRPSARLEQAQHVACCILAAVIPLQFIWSTLAIWLIILCWLIGGSYKDTWRHFRQQRMYWLWAAFFALHALSYFWSTDKYQSQFDTVSKLSFFVLPVVVGAGANVCNRRVEQILCWFAAGLSGVALFCVLHAGLLWHRDGLSSHFFYHDLVRGLEPNAVYMSWYVFVALTALLLMDWKYSFHRGGLLKWVFAAVLLLFLILLSSRLLLAFFFLLTVPAYLLKLFRARRGAWGIILAALIGIGSICGLLILTGNPVNRRFRDVMHRDVQIAYLPDYRDTVPHFNNLTLRLFVWRTAFDNMSRHRLWLNGCGNGDEHHVQNARFEELGITAERQQRYSIPLNNINLHNMYLQSLIMLGIPGLIIFLGIMILPLFALGRSGQPGFFSVFYIISILFMLQESALQTQAGVVFFTFFSCIYLQAVKRTSKHQKSPTLKT